MEQETLADQTNSKVPRAANGQVAKKSVEFRRQLRHSYREFSKAVDDQKDELVLPTSNLLHDMIAKVDTLHQDVCLPREHAVDSEVMCKLVECGVEMVKKLNPNESPYNPTLFIQRLLQSYVATMNTDAEVGDVDMPCWLDVAANASDRRCAGCRE